MSRHSVPRQCWLIAICLAVLAVPYPHLGSAQESRDLGPTLTEAEKQIARQVAEDEMDRLRLKTDSPLYLVELDLIQPKDEKGQRGTRRLARVVHYRYEGALAIVTFVDLASRRVERVDQNPHMAVPLATEEFALAKELALGDRGVQALLGDQASRVTVEAMVVHSTDRTDRSFGHRLVAMLFKVDHRYLAREVLVDLSARKVTIGEPPTREHSHREQPHP